MKKCNLKDVWICCARCGETVVATVNKSGISIPLLWVFRIDKAEVFSEKLAEYLCPKCAKSCANLFAGIATGPKLV